MTLLNNFDNGITTPLLGNEYRSSETSLMSAEENENLSDVDDDVFIQTGKSRNNFVDNGGKKVLMPPRKKHSSKPDAFLMDNVTTKSPSLFLPICYGLIALVGLIGSLAIISFAVAYFSSVYNTKWFSMHEKHFDKLPWKSMHLVNLWGKIVPQYDSAVIQNVDVNNDSTFDMIIGFGTGSYMMSSENNIICQIYFGGMKSCGGGVTVLDGKTGDTIWTYWTPYPIKELGCSVDFTQDGIVDCISSDTRENIVLINGAQGVATWTYHPVETVLSMFFIHISDVDSDHIPDLLLVINTPPTTINENQLLIISGVSGATLVTSTIPSGHVLLTAPVLHTNGDGSVSIVLGSQDYDGGGSILIVPLQEVLYGEHPEIHTVYRLQSGGISITPIIYNVDNDGIEDLLVVGQNGLMAVSGATYLVLWNTTFEGHFVRRAPAIGFYDNDSIGDIFLQMCKTSSNTTCGDVVFQVISGADGSHLVGENQHFSMASPPTPLSITTENSSIFIYWSYGCSGTKLSPMEYYLPQGLSANFLEHSPICWSMYGQNTTLSLMAFGRDIPLPGQTLFTFNLTSVGQEIAMTSHLGKEYKSRHPEIDLRNDQGIDEYNSRSNDYSSNKKKQSMNDKQDEDMFFPSYEDPYTLPKYNEEFARPVEGHHRRRFQPKGDFQRQNYPSSYDLERMPREAKDKLFVPILHAITPSLLPGSSYGQDNIDLALVVSWHHPFENLVLTLEDLKCLNRSNSQSLSQFEKITQCHSQRGIHDNRMIVTEEDYLEINMGKTHISRVNLKCANKNQQCYHALPNFLQEQTQINKHFFGKNI